MYRIKNDLIKKLRNHINNQRKNHKELKFWLIRICKRRNEQWSNKIFKSSLKCEK